MFLKFVYLCGNLNPIIMEAIKKATRNQVFSQFKKELEKEHTELTQEKNVIEEKLIKNEEKQSAVNVLLKPNNNGTVSGESQINNEETLLELKKEPNFQGGWRNKLKAAVSYTNVFSRRPAIKEAFGKNEIQYNPKQLAPELSKHSGTSIVAVKYNKSNQYVFYGTREWLILEEGKQPKIKKEYMFNRSEYPNLILKTAVFQIPPI